MSFSGDVKTELCRIPLNRRCCAQAEAYGVLLYCNTFSAREIRVMTESEAFAKRLPPLLKKAFRITFDRLPDGEGKYIFSITDRDKLAAVHQTFGSDLGALALHLNFAVLEESCCRTSFLRGAFLAGGSVTDPRKGYHLELATTHQSVSRELEALMREMELDIRGSVNRRVNCDAANLDKAVEAAMVQLEAIRRLEERGRLALLPDKLKETAALRLAHPEDTLSQLAERCDPPITKSALNHRLRKLVELGREEE